MKRYKFTLAASLALLLLALTSAMLFAAPIEPGKEWKQEPGSAPIVPRNVLKAHSDEWNNYYFERNVATELPYYFENDARSAMRGGLAGSRLAAPKPIAPKQAVQPHSDAWNAYYFDRNVNARFAPNATEYPQPALKRGGLAR